MSGHSMSADHEKIMRSFGLAPTGKRGRAPGVNAERVDSSERETQQVGPKNMPTLTASANGGENCGLHNLDVSRPPTTRRRVRVSAANASGQLRTPPIRGRAGDVQVV